MAEGAPAWGLRFCLVDAPSPASRPHAVHWLCIHPGVRQDSLTLVLVFSQVPKGVCVLEHAEYQVSLLAVGSRAGAQRGLRGQGPRQAWLVGAPLPATGRRPGGGEAPHGPASPAFPVPEARLSSLFIQVPELRLHRPQG